MLKAFKNDVALKTAMVKEVEKHRKADQILQGTYGRENGHWKGCAVACSLRSLDIIQNKELRTEYSDHKRYETDLGIPEWLARLEDTLFEGMPKEDALKWPTQFIKAISVGVNLEPVKWQFSAYLMKENIDRVLALKIDDSLKEQVVKAIRDVLAVHEKAIKTGKWSESAAWSAARSAARSAAWSAAWSAESAAWSAAWSAESAARSAARSAESAAWSAARSAESAARSAARSAESAAWSAAMKKHSQELLKMLKAVK